MPLFIATYDLNTGHGTFLAEARKRPWDCWIKGDDGKHHRLPNTTLVGTFATRAAAVQSLREVRAATETILKAKISMPKWIVTQDGGSTLDSDETS